jgi:hypothetical protein
MNAPTSKGNRQSAFGLGASTPAWSTAEDHGPTKSRISVRLSLLLRHLHETRWRKSPRNAGLKTAFAAEAMGLIEVRGELRSRTYRLTAAGRHYVNLLPDLPRGQGASAIASTQSAVLRTTARPASPAKEPGSAPVPIIVAPLACLQNGTIARLPGLTAHATKMQP